jgi:GH24 family phage-related lysozyme (muramidase)
MANKRLDPVSYRQFRTEPLLAEGLLAVARDGGDLERRVAVGLARMADTFGETADRQAARAGTLAGARDAAAGAPGAATVTGGETIGSVSATGSAGAGIRIEPGQGGGIDLAKGLLRHEEGFREAPYWDVTAHRVGYGSDTTVTQDGKVMRVTPGLRVTREDAERDLTHRLTSVEGAKVRSQVGSVWEKLPANVQAALYSVGYNYGSLPGNVAQVARTGDLSALASAVSGLGSNPDRRKREAAFMLNGAARPAPVADDGQPSYSKIPAASVAPISVTPIVTPVQVTPGKGGTFRPSGVDTIRGRAYDVAGTRTYLEELDLTMRTDQAAVYDAYKDDPVQLEKALGELETAHMRESVFEEIAPDYSRAFRGNSLTLVRQAKAEREKIVKAEERVGFLNRVGEYEDKKAQTLAGLDPRDPDAGAALSGIQGSIDAHYDSAVARNILTPGEAELAKRQSRSEGMVGFYVKQATSLRPEEIGAMHAEMRKDFAAGTLEGVTGADWEKIDEGLAAAQKARRTQDTQANLSLTTRGNDLAKRIASGQPVSAEELARFQLDAGTAPKGTQIVQSTLARMRVSDAIRKLPIGDVEKQLPKLLAADDGSARPEDIDFARKTIEKHKKELAADPLGVAERFGVLPITDTLPIGQDVSVDQAESAFAARMASADTAAEHFGVPPKYFRPEEKAQIKALMETDPNAALSIAAGVVSSAGPKATKILAELGTDAPGMEQAGTIMVLGGDTAAAHDLLAGYGKTPDGKAYPEMPIAKQRPVAADVVGSALVFDQANGRKFEAGAGAIARKRLYDAGIDPKSSEARPIYQRALNEAAGATFAGEVQYGGFAGYDPGFRWSERQVVVPGNVRADRFIDVVGSLTDADLGGAAGKNGKAWRAQDFQNAMPVRVDGGHVFALGDPTTGSPMFISDASGKPIVLDFEGELGKKLSARVPEAFR